MVLAFLACAQWSTGAESVYRQWHTLTLSFDGPMSSEQAEINPFTDYRLLVQFSQGDHTYWIRGFYAADGNAAETGSESGSTWQVRFLPDRTGEWSYQAALKKGRMIAINDDPETGADIVLARPTGRFSVLPSDQTGADFRGRGRLAVKDGYFLFQGTDQYWIKGGANSPENLLAYVDIDGTRRRNAQQRDGESKTALALHGYQPHRMDWMDGDPAWRGAKGRNLIGALNYLSSKGMNAVYFLTMNIGGDGQDVWPYTDDRERYRFDVSKLEQWEILFQHMQRRGILLHMVTQETENETLLDGGETGPQRKMYYRELIARFAHHPALIWNLGEENGPAGFSPEGQTAAQQKAMAAYLKASDPYRNPVLIHTHSWPAQKDETLSPLLGYPLLDGLSLQVDRPEQVNAEVARWRRKAEAAGHGWVITMDEIGPWHTGLAPDAVDPGHDQLRQRVLWGSLLAGAAGVEWYFGAHHPGNDLTLEDWRSRDAMWDQTRYAMQFMQRYLPFHRMAPANALLPGAQGYCFMLKGEIYAIYTPGGQAVSIDLEDIDRRFEIFWYDPRQGGDLQKGSTDSLSGPGIRQVGEPPGHPDRDWVVLLK